MNNIQQNITERFMRYVQIDTQSDPFSTEFPSTAKQLNLSMLLVEELREIGIDDAVLDEHGTFLEPYPAIRTKKAYKRFAFVLTLILLLTAVGKVLSQSCTKITKVKI